MADYMFRSKIAAKLHKICVCCHLKKLSNLIVNKLGTPIIQAQTTKEYEDAIFKFYMHNTCTLCGCVHDKIEEASNYSWVKLPCQIKKLSKVDDRLKLVE